MINLLGNVCKEKRSRFDALRMIQINMMTCVECQFDRSRSPMIKFFTRKLQLDDAAIESSS